MKYLLIFIVALTFIPSSIAQNSVASTSSMNFNSSFDEVAPKKQVVTYEIGRYEKTGDFSIFIPKNFSPNDDGINDVFQIQTRNIINFELMVFDQWGGFVYTDNTINLNWNGKVNDKLVHPGAYVYVIKLTTVNGQSKKYSGCLMIEE